MGLDMYLEKKTYVKNWSHNNEQENFAVTITRGGEPYPAIRPERIEYITEGVAQWRKANQIHQWFVDHCADGVDRNGDAVYVSIEQLEDLLTTCKEVVKHSKLIDGAVKNGETWDTEKKAWIPQMEAGQIIENPEVAKSLLPSQSGFFFGSTEYDQYYLDDVKETIEKLTAILEEEKADTTHRGDYYYVSSY